jgi:hypothetical protein
VGARVATESSSNALADLRPDPYGKLDDDGFTRVRAM